MIDKLKPCPFCGNEDYLGVSNGQFQGKETHYVECPECAGSSGHSFDCLEAIKMWNKRADGWQDIRIAPSGHYKTVKTPKGERIVFVPEWCFVMLDGVRYYTHKLENGRWNGFTASQKGDCWHSLPQPPKDNICN